MKNSIIKKIVFLSISIITVVAFYEILVLTKDNEFIFPKISEILKSIWNIITTGSNLGMLLNVIGKVVLIVLISVILSFLIGLLYVKVPEIDWLFKVFVAICKASPFLIVVLYLYVIFYDTRGIVPYLINFMIIFPITYEATINSLKNFDKGLIDDMALLNLTHLTKFKEVYVPLCLPQVLVGVLQSLGLGIKVTVMTEYICGVKNSIGEALSNATLAIEYKDLLAWLIIIVILVVALDILINIIIHKVKSLYVHDRKKVKTTKN